MTISFEDRILKPAARRSLEKEERRSKVVLRRTQRFFGAGGLCERYEHSGDPLIQFGDGLIDRLVASGLTREAVIGRFVFSARHGGFGWREYGQFRRTVSELIDLDDFSHAPPGQYSLRPVALRVELEPQLMRATRSTWVRWLNEQGWPVPSEFLAAAVPQMSPALREPSKENPKRRPERRGRPQKVFWGRWGKEIEKRLKEDGIPHPGDDGPHAELMRFATELADKMTDQPPVKSTIQTHLKSLIDAAKSRVGAEGR